MSLNITCPRHDGASGDQAVGGPDLPGCGEHGGPVSHEYSHARRSGSAPGHRPVAFRPVWIRWNPWPGKPRHGLGKLYGNATTDAEGFNEQPGHVETGRYTALAGSPLYYDYCL